MGGEWLPQGDSILIRRIIEDNPWTSLYFPSWTIVDASGPLLEDRQAWREIESYGHADDIYMPVDSRSVQLETTRNAARALYQSSRESESAQTTLLVPDLEGNSSLFRFSKDRKTVAFVNESLTRPQEIYVRDANAILRKVSSLNGAVAQRAMPEFGQVEWTSGDGVKVRGWLLRPRSPRHEGRLPLIVYVHGGPATVFDQTFAGNFETWPYPLEVYPAYGYAVFVPNYRGSVSFGRLFQSPSALDREPVQDVVTGVQHLIDVGIADPQRLGLVGHSHGAWLGPLIMTRAKIFRVGSFAAGWSNYLTLYDLMDDNLNREFNDPLIGASPYESPQRYLELSPELHLRDVHTATLFEAGALDSALTMMAYPKAARRAGMPAEFVVYPRAAHNLTRPRLMRESAERNLDWFRFWMSGKIDPSPRKQGQYSRWQQLVSHELEERMASK
jgi:dipeptidyl aminopeptidase/acylaminoacyl peptidase